jgi:hypothetical protein
MFVETTATIILVVGGCLLALIPAKYLLKIDRRSGYWLYTQELKASGDEKKAIGKASVFYKTLGICLIVFPLALYLSFLFLSANSH